MVEKRLKVTQLLSGRTNPNLNPGSLIPECMFLTTMLSVPTVTQNERESVSELSE